MAREIHLRLQGKAEQTFNKLIEAGLTEQDILSRALWIFDQAVTTGRVAMLDAWGNVLFTLGLEAKHEPKVPYPASGTKVEFVESITPLPHKTDT